MKIKWVMVFLGVMVMTVSGCANCKKQSCPISGLEQGSSSMTVEYTLIFEDFNNKQMVSMEEYIEIFSGYNSHRPDPGAINSATYHTYIYKSRIGSAKLKRNLVKALDELNLNGHVSVAGRTYTIKKVGMPKDRSRSFL